MPVEPARATTVTASTGGQTHSPSNLLDSLAVQTLANRGWVMLDGIPPLESQVEAILSPLGDLMPQYGQKKFWPVEAQDAGTGTSLGDQELRLHTELAEFSSPPEYVALYAERPAAEGGALRLYDSRPFTASLTAHVLEALLKTSMTIKAEGPIADRYGEYSYTGPVLSVSPSGLQLRFDQHYIDQKADLAICDFRDQLLLQARDAVLEVKQKRGSLMVWDNRFILHGRSAFAGSSRLLWRCCIRARP